jgi:hypothetical protein
VTVAGNDEEAQKAVRLCGTIRTSGSRHETCILHGGEGVSDQLMVALHASFDHVLKVGPAELGLQEATSAYNADLLGLAAWGISGCKKSVFLAPYSLVISILN